MCICLIICKSHTNKGSGRGVLLLLHAASQSDIALIAPRQRVTDPFQITYRPIYAYDWKSRTTLEFVMEKCFPTLQAELQRCNPQAVFPPEGARQIDAMKIYHSRETAAEVACPCSSASPSPASQMTGDGADQLHVQIRCVGDILNSLTHQSPGHIGMILVWE